MEWGKGVVVVSFKCKNIWFASSVTVVSKKSHQSAKEGFVSLTFQPVKCIVLYSVRMESMVQPPVSSLLLYARVAGRVSIHL